MCVHKNVMLVAYYFNYKCSRRRENTQPILISLNTLSGRYPEFFDFFFDHV